MIRLGPGGRRLAAVLGPLLVVVGVVGMLVGMGWVVAAAVDDLRTVDVPVRVVSNDGGAAHVEFYGQVAAGLTVSGAPTGGLSRRDYHSDPLGILTVTASGATVTEQVLSRADLLLRGVALLTASLVLLPVLRRLAQGRSLERDDGRRVAVVAGCVVLGTYVAPLVPWWATASVLRRFPVTTGMTADPPHHLQAFVVAALVLLVGSLVRAVAAQEVVAQPARPTT